MKKKKIRFDKKIDLHGFTQQEAFEILAENIPFFYESQKKVILIITGKSGILKSSVPNWLNSNSIFSCIREITSAPNYLGGEGAILLFMRSKN
ncbi:MAG: Smr/MutS family protein [Alphaproteobacteria bacterium]